MHVFLHLEGDFKETSPGHDRALTSGKKPETYVGQQR